MNEDKRRPPMQNAAATEMFHRQGIYGHRARIGYTSPPFTTEVFPYEFYKIVPTE